MTTTRTDRNPPRLAHTRGEVVVSTETPARWRARAACAEVVCDDEWFPAPRAAVNPLVLRICAACPVRRDCLLFALAHPDIWHGIWAGLTAREIAELRDRLLAGEPAATVLDQARRLTKQRGTVPVYYAAVPHPLPSRRQLRRHRHRLISILRAAGLLIDAPRRTGSVA